MTIVAWLLAIGTTMPLLIVSIECCAGLARSRSDVDPEIAPAFTVLMPAHDEAAGIGAVVAAVRQQLRSCDRLLVVADNCTDATAEIARAGGATVCVRTDPDLLGKAHALAVGRTVLRAAPPSVVIVLDADCVPEPGALRRLAATAQRLQAAVQGEYLLTLATDAGPLVRISTFAFLVKNRVRQRGLRRVGAPALLQGTGMALPWRLFETAPLVTTSLVEDLKLGLDLALAGNATVFDDRAGFRSPASTQGATTGQRTRWEQGMLTTAAQYVPPLLFAGLTRRAALLMLAADLIVPPLAMLAMVAIAVVGALALLGLAGAPLMPLAIVIAALTLCAATLAVAWAREGRAILPVVALPAIGHYILWKLPIYLGVVYRRQRRWVRTSRAS